MNRNFCGKCNSILPKGKIVFNKCGYDNPELITVFRGQIKRSIFFQRIIFFASVVALILILNANLLFPWQSETRKNKRAIFNYVNEYYPHAKVVSTHYESKSFDPWSAAIDTVVFEWNGVNFTIRAEQGDIIVDDFLEKNIK